MQVSLLCKIDKHWGNKADDDYKQNEGTYLDFNYSQTLYGEVLNERTIQLLIYIYYNLSTLIQKL